MAKKTMKSKMVTKVKQVADKVKEEVEDTADAAKGTMKKVNAVYRKADNWAKRRKKA